MTAVQAVASAANPLLVRVRKLARDPGAYRKLGEVWIEGEHLCAAFAERGGATARHALISEAAWQTGHLHDLAIHADRVTVVPAALLAAASALASPPPLGFIVAWPGAGTPRPGRPSIVLDRLQDAGNVGSILRSAAAFGFHQVVALAGTAALWSPKVLRAAMGAHFGLQLVEDADAGVLAGLGVPLLATSSHADTPIQAAVLPWPCAWIVGNEGQGVDADLQRRCTTLRIDQPGGQESLNVAVAAALCMYASTLSMRVQSA